MNSIFEKNFFFSYLWSKDRFLVLVSAPTIYVEQIREIMFTPANPTFPYTKWDLRRCSLYGLINIMVCFHCNHSCLLLFDVDLLNCF